MKSAIKPDPWQPLGAWTAARIALGRAGAALPTRAVLDFDIAHALARDAVHQPLDVSSLMAGCREQLARDVVVVHSRAGDRTTYLQRPYLGRRLDAAGVAALGERPGPCELAIVIADGLSATAVQAHVIPLLQALLPLLDGLRMAPLVIAEQGRVALGDEIGALMGARLVLILLGERPGLSAPDSLGAYLTFAPQVGRLDAERNCVSNIRDGGLPPEAAARKLAWLVRAALACRLTGVSLKDDSEAPPVTAIVS
ncbi:MAG: ethanolamine ammonia-lyase subunit EutC [Azonexus sp.]|nr:ethanolamine ammonia-lyase subunit EutC [Azonexus sp.]